MWVIVTRRQRLGVQISHSYQALCLSVLSKTLDLQVLISEVIPATLLLKVLVILRLEHTVTTVTAPGQTTHTSPHHGRGDVS